MAGAYAGGVVESLRRHQGRAPKEALELLHTELKEFVAGEPIEDDLTLLLAEFS